MTNRSSMLGGAAVDSLPSSVPSGPDGEAHHTAATLGVSRAEQPIAQARQAAFSVRVAHNLGQSVIRTAGLAKQVGRDIAGVAQAAAFDRQQAAAKSKQLAGDTNVLLRRVGTSFDPRVIVGGFAGMTAGQVMGGAVGGVVGTLVGGPPGALAGAQVGALTGGMLGLKVGTDAGFDLVEAPGANQAPPPIGQAGAQINNGTSRKRATRLGEAVGIASGASVGSLVAGPVAGIVAGIVGQVVGGQVGKETIRAAPNPTVSPPAKPTVALSDDPPSVGAEHASTCARHEGNQSQAKDMA